MGFLVLRFRESVTLSFISLKWKVAVKFQTRQFLIFDRNHLDV